MRSSLAISTNWRTAAITSAEVLVRCPRRRLGRRISVWTPPTQWTSRTISAAAAGAAVARDMMLRSRVAEGQFTPASATAEQARQQSVAVLGRTMVTAGGYVAADHLADRFGLIPADITLMGVRHQRQPVAACFAADLHLDAGPVVARHDGRLTIGIGAAVDGVAALAFEPAGAHSSSAMD